jgi:hypothetical protein
MKKKLAVLAVLIAFAGFAWADPPKGRIPKGEAPKVGPAQPQFRGDFVPGKRARPPMSYSGFKRPLPKLRRFHQHKIN